MPGMKPAAVLVLLLLSASTRVAAHHSFAAEFDADVPGERSGTITEVRFSNPHVRYRMQTPTADGGVEEWELQASSVTALRGRNWTADTIKVGDQVRAWGLLGRNDSKKIWLQGVETADGRRILNTSAQGEDPNRITAVPGKTYGYGQLNPAHPFDISGPWNNRYHWRLTVDDLEPKPVPFTAAGRARFEQTEHFDDPALRCDALGLPRIFGAPYNMDIVDAGSHYLIVHVEHNTPRRIWMDGRTPPPDLPATSMGFSVGRWEGDALVIQTTHLLPGWLDGSGLPMAGDGTRIEERYEFNAERTAMERIMTIHDPNYTAPLIRRRGSARGENIDLYEQSACDPTGYYRDLQEAGKLEEYLGK